MDLLSNAFITKHFEPGGWAMRAYEEGLMARVFEKLWEHYPQYNWRVKVDARPEVGMVMIQLPQLHHQTLGWNFAIDKLDTDPAMGIVKKAGGELLERFRLRRGKANKAAFREAIFKKQVHKITDAVDGGTALENKGRTVHPTQKPRLLVPMKDLLVPANHNAVRPALAA